MWTTLISVAGTLVGTLLGVMLEPIRSRVTARAHRKERLVERCALVIDSAITSGHGLVELNPVYRRTMGSHEDISQEQMNTLRSEVHGARKQLVRAVAMLRVDGPDELVARADAVWSRYMELLMATVGTPSSPELVDTPEEAMALANALDDAIRESAAAARKHTV